MGILGDFNERRNGLLVVTGIAKELKVREVGAVPGLVIDLSTRLSAHQAQSSTPLDNCVPCPFGQLAHQLRIAASKDKGQSDSQCLFDVRLTIAPVSMASPCVSNPIGFLPTKFGAVRTSARAVLDDGAAVHAEERSRTQFLKRRHHETAW
jgi:hypothetical protein